MAGEKKIIVGENKKEREWKYGFVTDLKGLVKYGQLAKVRYNYSQ